MRYLDTIACLINKVRGTGHFLGINGSRILLIPRKKSCAKATITEKMKETEVYDCVFAGESVSVVKQYVVASG